MEGWVDLGYPAMHRPVFELAIFRSRVRRPTTTLPSQPSSHYSTALNRKLSDMGCLSYEMFKVVICSITRFRNRVPGCNYPDPVSTFELVRKNDNAITRTHTITENFSLFIGCAFYTSVNEWSNVNTCVNKNSNNSNKQREVIVITQGDKWQAQKAGQNSIFHK